jgi:hypothetical protein
MQVDRITAHAYTLIVDANGGEEQLLIAASGGQDGRFAVGILAMQVDGGGRIFRSPSSPRITLDQTIEVVKKAVRRWGIQNREAEDQILGKWKSNMGID